LKDWLFHRSPLAVYRPHAVAFKIQSAQKSGEMIPRALQYRQHAEAPQRHPEPRSGVKANGPHTFCLF